jgi:outer membrane receptor for ferrienterochelin and colicin
MKKFFCLVAAVMALSAPAAAQEQGGSIEGTVKDSAGGVLPGVVVEARSPALVGVQSTVTDANGTYRFPALAPGSYTVTATLQGFAAAKVSSVALELGKVLKVDLVLAPAGVAETIQVTGDSPLIDVKQNAAGANLQAETIERIPRARNFVTLVTLAPGVTDEARGRGIQIDGGSGADNRFMIDGVDTTDLRFGTSGKTLATDFVQEVQVKSSGYNAEYRAAIGGVISAITKSGGNQFHGSAGIYFRNQELLGDVRPSLRFVPSNTTLSEYFTQPVDDFTDTEPVFELGGPILRDRVWFYAGYNPNVTETRRTVRFNANQQTGTFESRPVDQNFTGNLTGQLRPNLRGRFTATTRRTKGGVGLPGINADGTSNSTPSQFPMTNRTDSFNDSYSGVVDWVVDNKTFVNFTTTYLTYGGKGVGTFSDAQRHVFNQSTNFCNPNAVPGSSGCPFPEIPTGLQQLSGYSDFPASGRTVRDDLSRINVNGDMTRYLNWGGQHTLKAGVQFEHIENSVLSGAQAETIDLFWNADYVANNGQRYRGKYGHYNVTRLYTQGDVTADSLGFFVQDAWTVNNRLTLNLGLRTEREDIPSYREDNPGIEFGFGQKIAPRIGFAWDVNGDSKLKAYGSWGMFYDQMKLTLGRVMFGADRWMNWHFTLDTFDWQSITCTDPPDFGSPSCPGTFIESFDFRPVANDANDPNFQLVDPDLHPIRTQEFTLGLDRELTKSMSVGVRYVHKWADYAIEAVCALVPSGEACGVNNPGFGTGRYPFGTSFPAQPEPVRDYDGLEIRLRKRLANRWSLDTSYLLSRLQGNWSGIASSDEAVGSLQPYSGRAFDLLYYSFDAAGNPSYGRLGTDRPHQFKLQATYSLPWGTTIGTNFLAESGVPLSTVANQNNIGFFPYGRGDVGRSPAFTQTDLFVQQEVRLTGHARVSIGVNVSNLFDQDTATAYIVTPYRDGLNVADEQFFAGFDPEAVVAARPSFRRDARYGLASGFQERRSIRLQAKFSF